MRTFYVTNRVSMRKTVHAEHMAFMPGAIVFGNGEMHSEKFIVLAVPNDLWSTVEEGEPVDNEEDADAVKS